MLVALPAQAQSTGAWALGAAASGGLWVGGGDPLDGGIGVDLTVWRRLAPAIGLRSDLMLMPFQGSSDPVESADNRVLVVGLGPELGGSVGSVSAYVRGLVGLAINQQRRSRSTLPEQTTRALVFGGGGGLGVDLSSRVTLDVGADILRVGELEFARTLASGVSIGVDAVVLRVRSGVRLRVGP